MTPGLRSSMPKAPGATGSSSTMVSSSRKTSGSNRLISSLIFLVICLVVGIDCRGAVGVRKSVMPASIRASASGESMMLTRSPILRRLTIETCASISCSATSLGSFSLRLPRPGM